MSNEWRRIVAALDNPGRRAVYAELVLGVTGLPTTKRTKAIAALQDAGLVDDEGKAIPDVFARLLAEHPPVTRTGIDRWVVDGRIQHYPAKPADRLEVLEWVATQLTPGSYSEAEITEQLTAFTSDVASLRRYLVDAELIHRDADGSIYRLT